jgi:hypothetical protein
MANSETKASCKERVYEAYRVTSPGHETRIVFAAGIWSAVGVLLQWRVANGIGQVGFHLDPTWAEGLEGVARKHIDEARALCLEPRIGTRYRADVGWALMGPTFKAGASD